MTVPRLGRFGSSPDFKFGPIIPNSLFPIQVVGQTFRDNQPWNPYLAILAVPPLTLRPHSWFTPRISWSSSPRLHEE